MAKIYINGAEVTPMEMFTPPQLNGVSHEVESDNKDMRSLENPE